MYVPDDNPTGGEWADVFRMDPRRNIGRFIGTRKGERDTDMSEMLERILDGENIELAKKRVISNGGSFGVDKMKVGELDEYLRENLEGIRAQIRARSYRPLPVRRVEIPKPNGGVRKLGIPTVADRVIQQAIVQVLSPLFEPTFSDFSYGFRPGRRAQQAIVKALEYFNDGYIWVVDIDLEKFFDNVPQDRLMSYVHRTLNDGDTESLIRKYLQAGIMENGVFIPSDVGTPQGGNLSPLLSNVMLTELDRELEARGLRFTRYADDCIIVVKSHAAANRVMHSVVDFIERKLGLRVNATKTKITPPNHLTYLGFGFYADRTGRWNAIPAKASKEKFARKIKSLCRRNWSVDMSYRIRKLNEVTRGWINYFRIGRMKTFLENLTSHLMTQLRVVIWKQWKVRAKRVWALRKLGVPEWAVQKEVGIGNRYYKAALLPHVKKAISKERLVRKGLVVPLDYYLQNV